MNTHSSSLKGPGLVMMASGIAKLADVVQRGGLVELGEFLAVDAHAAADVLDELGDAVVVLAEVGVPFRERAHQHVAALTAGGRAPGLLLRVHRAVGLAHRFGRVAGVQRGSTRSRTR